MKVYLHPNLFLFVAYFIFLLVHIEEKVILSLKGYTLSNTGYFMYICNHVVQEVLFWHEELVMLSILEWLCEIMWDDTEKLVNIIEIILLFKDKSLLTYRYRKIHIANTVLIIIWGSNWVHLQQFYQKMCAFKNAKNVYDIEWSTLWTIGAADHVNSFLIIITIIIVLCGIWCG